MFLGLWLGLALVVGGVIASLIWSKIHQSRMRKLEARRNEEFQNLMRANEISKRDSAGVPPLLKHYITPNTVFNVYAYDSADLRHYVLVGLRGEGIRRWMEITDLEFEAPLNEGRHKGVAEIAGVAINRIVPVMPLSEDNPIAGNYYGNSHNEMTGEPHAICRFGRVIRPDDSRRRRKKPKGD
jgi:hypothetical protein